jgi:hypothetical protein
MNCPAKALFDPKANDDLIREAMLARDFLCEGEQRFAKAERNEALLGLVQGILKRSQRIRWAVSHGAFAALESPLEGSVVVAELPGYRGGEPREVAHIAPR